MKCIPRSVWHTMLISSFLILLCCTPAVAATVEVRENGGRFALEAQDADMTDVLRAVAQKTGIPISVAPGVSGRVTAKLSDVSLEEILRQLCANQAIVYRYVPETNAYQIIDVGAYASVTDGLAGGAAAQAQAQVKTQARVNASPPGGKDGRQAGGDGDSTDENPTDSQGRLLYKPRELLIQFKAETTDAQREALHRSVGATVLKRLEHLRVDRVQLPAGMRALQGIEFYEDTDFVENVERHALRYAQFTPNDTNYSSQWAPPKVKLPQAWNVTTGTPRVIIAVIDTGVDYNHPDLAENIWINPGEIPGNGIDDDGNGLIDDVRGWDFSGNHGTVEDNDPADKDGHGTHVAGIIAARGNNGLGIAGAAWTARLMVLKVQADNKTTMESLDIIQAIDYAVAKGARLINCSFGGETYSEIEYQAFTRLRTAGMLTICAAGNDGKNIDAVAGNKTYPASYSLDNIIAVAASDQSDQLASFSNYGSESVHLMAPGVSVLSTCRNALYCEKQGTSMAAPSVTGVAALLLTKVPMLSYAQLKSAIMNTVDPIASVATKLITGGRLNAAAALASVRAPGDLNNEGRIDLMDAILALQISSNISSDVIPGPLTMQADVNADGRIGLAEALHALQWASALRSDNHTPVLAAVGNRAVDENSTLTFTIQASDQDQDVLTYSATNLPPGARFTPQTRTFLWTPTYSQSGLYTVTFVVSDGYGGQDHQTITITVNDRTPVFTVADYFPLNVGDWWDYNDGTAIVKRNSITGTKTINSVETKVMSYSDGQKDYYRLDGAGLILYGQYVLSASYTGDVIFETPVFIIRSDAYPGMTHVSTTTYTMTLSGYIFNVDLTSTTTLTGLDDLVIGGTSLPNCIKVTHQINQTIRETGQNITGSVNNYWFAHGIGRVKSDTQTLVTATINGVLKTF
ncbi:MAG: hypothetical protein C0394_05675 [Syntrophus sp. (in: bacteria)]|nr:hypothetical protein [Syntrophus sp. (in: bacteria)]